jgi:hypothetical protein
MRYAIVIEKAEGNYSAYVPDLPGSIATAADQDRSCVGDQTSGRSFLKGKAFANRP